MQQKQENLAKAIEATEDKLKKLKEAQVQAKKQLEEGKLGKDQYEALQREIIKTEQELGKLKGEASIKFDADAHSLKQALDEVDSKLKNTQINLQEIDKLLKLDPTSTELLAQKQETLSQAIGQSEEKLKLLKDAHTQAQQQFERGELGKDKVEALEREIISTEQEIKILRGEAEKSIQFNADSAKIQQALTDISSKLEKTKTDLRDVDALLKLDPTNTELLAQKQDLLKQAVEQTEEKLKLLKDAHTQAQAQFENGELGKDKVEALQREIISTEQELKNLRTESEKAIKFNADTARIQQALEDVNTKIKKTQEDLKEIDRLLKLDPTSTELLAQKQKLLADAAEQSKEKIRLLKEQLEMGNLGADKFDELQREIIETEQELKNLAAEAGNAVAALERMDRVGQTLQSVGSQISSVGKTLTAAVTMPIVGLGTAAVKTGMDFDAAMSKVKAISGATGEQFDTLCDKAREMGAKTKYSATEAANAFSYMAMAGWDVDKMLAGIEPVMNLAAASGTDLARASDILTDAMTAMKMPAEEAGHFADVLAATANNANTNVELLGESFKYVATTAGTYGFTIEDVAVALGLMANAGIKGTQAGNNLKNALVNLTKPTKQQAQAMQTLGLITTEYVKKVDPAKITKAQDAVKKATLDLQSAQLKYNEILAKHDSASATAVAAHNRLEKAKMSLKQAQDKLTAAQEGTVKAVAGQNLVLDEGTGKMRSLDEIMRILRAALGDTKIELTDSTGQLKDFDQIIKDVQASGAELTTIQKLQAAATIFGKQNMAGMLAIIQASEEDYDKLSAKVKGATYNFDDLSKKLQESGVDFTKFSENINKTGDSFKDFAKKVANMITEARKNGQDMSTVVDSLVSGFGLSAEEAKKAVGIISEEMGKFGGAAKDAALTMNDNLAGQLTILKSALQELAIQISDALTPKIKGIVSHVQTFVEHLQKMDDGTKNTILQIGFFAAAIGPVLTVIGYFTSGIGDAISGIANFGKGIVTFVKQAELGVGAGGKVMSALSALTGPIGVVVAALGVLTAAFVYLWETNEEFRNKVTAIWENVKAAFSKLYDSIADALKRLAPLFEVALLGIKTIWEGFCQLLAPILEGAFTIIASVLQSAVDILSGIIDFWAGVFTGDWERIWNGIKSIFEGVWTLFEGIVSGVFTAIKGVITTYFSWLTSFWSDSWNAIKAVFETIWDGISSFFSGIWNGLKEIVSTVLDAISSAISTAFDTVADVFSSIWDGIKDDLEAVWNTMKNIVQVALMAIGSLIEAAFQIITIPFVAIWENCKDTITAAWDKIKSGVQESMNLISGVIKKSWEKIKSTLTPVLKSITDYISDRWVKASTAVSDVSDSVQTKLSDTWTAIKEKVSPLVEATTEWIADKWNTAKERVSSASDATSEYVSSKWENLKEKISGISDAIKDYVSSRWDAIRDYTTGIWDRIKDYISGIWDNIKDSVTSKVQGMWDKVKGMFTGLWEDIKGIIQRIKDVFSFEWKLPKIKLPHFKIEGSFSLSPPSVPHLSIEWYKKAMNDAYILNDPTIFGSLGGHLLGGGEAGSEVVVGTDKLVEIVSDALKDVLQNTKIAVKGDNLLADMRTAVDESIKKLSGQNDSPESDFISTAFKKIESLLSNLEEKISQGITAIQNIISEACDFIKSTFSTLSVNNSDFTEKASKTADTIQGAAYAIQQNSAESTDLAKTYYGKATSSNKTSSTKGYGFKYGESGVSSEGTGKIYYGAGTSSKNKSTNNSAKGFKYKSAAEVYTATQKGMSDALKTATQNTAELLNKQQDTIKSAYQKAQSYENSAATSQMQNTLSEISQLVKGINAPQADSNITIPVYIGQDRLDEIVVKSINNNNYRSGGR